MTLRGRSRAHSWRVVAVDPVESPIHPNAFVGTLEKLGPWEYGDLFDLWYITDRHPPPPNCR